ncbi:hypothetical protein P7E02_14820 [Enterococcus hulanensis]|uniref:hypothetical protein n=1 Tax=Enterococcus hulanensis TaxID=2559929 RepID=UPI00288F8046|nr:hypothetical protein [Enterococcus hulanensis]MDT2661145.1 hypothetical protein [Enterococcus hulanensis]
MEYDEIIGELYDVIHEVEDDDELVDRIRSLNFEVRKNGIKDGPDKVSTYGEEDVRIELSNVITQLQNLADQAKQKEVKHHLIAIEQDLSSIGITPSF